MRILRALLVLVLLALLLLGVLVWTAPADIAYRYLRDRFGPIELSGITGSVWQGRAAEVTALGRGLGALDWRLAKGPLFSRRLDGHFVLGGAGIEGSADVAGGNDELRIANLKLALPAELLGPAMDIPALVFEGRVVLDVPEAQLAGGYLRTARGSAVWQDIGVRGAAVARLPGIRADFAPTPDGTIEAKLDDLGGALDVDGIVKIRDGAFTCEARLALREPDPHLAEMLKFIGERTPDGASLLRVEGTLEKLW